MVIDINYLREGRGGCPDKVRQSEKDRFRNPSSIDKIIEYDSQWRNLRYTIDTLNRNRNNCSKSIGQKMKKKEEQGVSDLPPNVNMESLADDFIEKLSINQLKNLSTNIDSEIQIAAKKLTEVCTLRDNILNEIGNLIHPSVVISNNEDENGVERIVGDCSVKEKYSHVDLLLMIDGADYKRGVSVAGNRAYFLKGPAVFLANALVQFALRKLYNNGYTVLYTPFFMKKSVMQEVAQLSQFDEELYKVIAKSEETGVEDNEEKYLIATSEQAIAAYHRDEWLDANQLPIKYAGISTCFRQEVGSHGRDTSGIFRVHQFEKVEQFVICSPRDDESWKMFDTMIKNAEDFTNDLGIGYRIVNIVSGALNNAAAKKYDLEAWFPASGAFRELVSCSNCTDYQSRRLAIRYGLTKQKNQEVEYVHMLNATMCAVSRVLCCLLETHQTEDGIIIPEVLHPYLPDDMKKINFIKKLNN